MSSNKEKTSKYLLSQVEAAELFGVSPSTIDHWRADKILPFLKIGKGQGKNKTVRYPLDKLMKFINENTMETKLELMEKSDLYRRPVMKGGRIPWWS